MHGLTEFPILTMILYAALIWAGTVGIAAILGSWQRRAQMFERERKAFEREQRIALRRR